MLRILHIARYRNRMMERKVEFMSQDTDFLFFLVRPKQYKDAYGSLILQSTATKTNNILHLSLIGKHIDPHRVLYGSLSFSMISFKPDIIHAEDEPDSLAALQVLSARRLFAPKAKLILHTWQNINRKKRPLVKWITNTALQSSDGILCSNAEGVKVLCEMGFNGLTDVVPPEGVDIEWFKPSGQKQHKNRFTLLYAGRLVEEKGLDTLLEALSLTRNEASLVLVGDGPLKDTLKEQANRLKIKEQVQFLPPVQQDSMPNLYAQTDGLVLPSRGTPVWKEQYGRVLLEAMACKVPVIGSDSGAIPEVIGAAGLIFKENDARALAQCIQNLMENPTLQKDLAERGYKRVTSFYSQKEIARRTNEFYRKVMDSKHLK
jgi:glycosyltransferase involved in cell wall biosynthesis